MNIYLFISTYILWFLLRPYLIGLFHKLTERNANYRRNTTIKQFFEERQENVSIAGKIFKDYDKNINSCYKKQDEVVKILKSDFVNTDFIEPKKLKKHQADKTGKSTVRQVGFFFNNNDVIALECYNWSKEKNHSNNFKISLSTDELNKWYLTNE